MFCLGAEFHNYVIPTSRSGAECLKWWLCLGSKNDRTKPKLQLKLLSLQLKTEFAFIKNYL